MKKLFIFGDVHSFYNELKTALDEVGFNKENEDHILVSLGDLCDRGPDAQKCLNLLNSLPKNRKICVIGNHELLMEEMLARGFDEVHDISNGTVGTVEQLTYIYDEIRSAIMDMKSNSKWNQYKNSWVWYAEVGNNIFVHGWIPCDIDYSDFRKPKYSYNKDWRNLSAKKFDEATWMNGMECWHQGVVEEGKKIYAGHWHTSYAWANFDDYGVEFVKRIETMYFSEKYQRMYPFACYDIYEKDDCCFLDACTVVSHKVNVKVVEISDEDWNNYLNSR